MSSAFPCLARGGGVDLPYALFADFAVDEVLHEAQAGGHASLDSMSLVRRAVQRGAYLGNATSAEPLARPTGMLSVNGTEVDVAQQSNVSAMVDKLKESEREVSAAAAAKVVQPRSIFAITFSMAFLIKCLCMLSNVLFQVSPYPQVAEFAQKQDTGEADAAPFISIMYSGWQWCFYGFFAYEVTQKSGFLVLVYSNMLGGVLGLYYTLAFREHCKDTKARNKCHSYLAGVSVSVSTQLCAMLFLRADHALFFCGLVSSLCSIGGALSLLSTLPQILQSKCSATINLRLVAVGMVSVMLWEICGIVLWDPWIILPNIACMMINLFAIVLALYFPRELTQGNGPDPIVRGMVDAMEAARPVTSTTRRCPAPNYGAVLLTAGTGETM